MSIKSFSLFQNHYHPSVKVYSEKFLKGSKLGYNGDPFMDFTLIKFLDKFVNKKPKKEREESKQCECIASCNAIAMS